MLTVKRNVDDVVGFYELHVLLLKVDAILEVELSDLSFLFAAELFAAFIYNIIEEHGVFTPFNLAFFFALTNSTVDTNCKL